MTGDRLAKNNDYNIYDKQLNHLKMTSSHAPDWKQRLTEDEARVKRMDIWYKEDGRNNPSHPKHGLYTGLARLAEEGKLAGVLADTCQSIDPLNNEN